MAGEGLTTMQHPRTGPGGGRGPAGPCSRALTFLEPHPHHGIEGAGPAHEHDRAGRVPGRVGPTFDVVAAGLRPGRRECSSCRGRADPGEVEFPGRAVAPTGPDPRWLA